MGPSWKCPACQDAAIAAATEEALYWAVRRHIAEHEARAGSQAVDRARASCSRADCGIGRCRVKGPDGLWMITDFDRGFLRTLKVGW